MPEKDADVAGAKELSEWMISFIKHKDVIKKSILSIETKEGQGQDKIFVKYKDKEQEILILPQLDSSSMDVIKKSLENKSKELHVAVVVLNSDNNLNFLVKNWGELSKYALLSFYFVNPASSLEQKWIIFPYTHDKVTEKSALKTGLLSIAETVDRV